jgi:hypothetical protein
VHLQRARSTTRSRATIHRRCRLQVPPDPGVHDRTDLRERGGRHLRLAARGDDQRWAGAHTAPRSPTSTWPTASERRSPTSSPRRTTTIRTAPAVTTAPRARCTQFDGVGGGAAGGETYGDCAPCVADAQCGGEADLCVPPARRVLLRPRMHWRLRTQPGLCRSSPASTDHDGYQCVPENADCGQVCTADDLRGSRRHATTWPRRRPSNPGRTRGPEICDQDSDVFTRPVDAGQSVTARIIFENARGDLDLFMQMPGDAARRLPVSERQRRARHRVRRRTLHSRRRAGCEHRRRARTRARATSTRSRSRSVPATATRCASTTRYDDAGNGNDVLDDFVARSTSSRTRRSGLVICRQDADYYGFDVARGRGRPRRDHASRTRPAISTCASIRSSGRGRRRVALLPRRRARSSWMAPRGRHLRA